MFSLEALEGRLFWPLAFTKTYAMAAAAGLSATLIPVLMGYLIWSRIPDEKTNPLNRLLIAVYRPILDVVLRAPKTTLAVAAVAAVALVLSLWPLQHMGGEFMPKLDEGDLLCMPSALPGSSAGKAAELLQQTDRLIRTVHRIDMLATGIKTSVGVEVAGTGPAVIDRVTVEIERALKDVPGVSSALAERLTGGRYVDVTINRDAAARFGTNIADVQSVITSAVGGDNIGETVEGLRRFPVNLRYAREIRDSLEKLRLLPIVTEKGARLVLSDVADIRITDGPPMLRS